MAPDFETGGAVLMANLARIKWFPTRPGGFAASYDLEVLEIDGKDVTISCTEFRLIVKAGEKMQFEAICMEDPGSLCEKPRYTFTSGLVEFA